MSPQESTNRSEHARPDRVGWAVMGAAIVAYAGLALYLSRGATFTFDDLTWLVDSDGFRPGAILTPHYGHLIADTRVLYAAMLATIGPSELLIRVSVIVATAATALLLYALVKRRLGPLAALAPAVIVLLLGATPEPLLPSFMSFPQATAFGLGALLVLERRSRHGDAIACLLLVLSAAALEVGLAFAVAAAVVILADSRRLRRCWVFLVPMVLFAAWWAWARQFDQGIATGVNVLLIPAFAADAVAAATSALAGLGHSFSSPAGSPLAIDWGRSLAPALAVAICWQGYRRGITRELLGFLALALFLLSGFALGYGPLRTPDADRYAYPIAIAIVLLAAEAFRGMRVTRTVLLALSLATLFALPANIYQLRNNGAANRENSQRVEAEQVALDLARDQVSPDFNGDLGLPDVTRAEDYYALVDEYGPITITPDQLEAKPEWVREVTDAILLRILKPGLEPAPSRPAAGCTAVPSAGGSAAFPLPQGGALLRAQAPGTISISRFADAQADLGGVLPTRGLAALELPADGYGRPWTATVRTRGGAVTVCPLAPGGEG